MQSHHCHNWTDIIWTWKSRFAVALFKMVKCMMRGSCVHTVIYQKLDFRFGLVIFRSVNNIFGMYPDGRVDITCLLVFLLFYVGSTSIVLRWIRWWWVNIVFDSRLNREERRFFDCSSTINIIEKDETVLKQRWLQVLQVSPRVSRQIDWLQYVVVSDYFAFSWISHYLRFLLSEGSASFHFLSWLMLWSALQFPTMVFDKRRHLTHTVL